MLTVNLDAVSRNLSMLRAHIGEGVGVCAVVKADAYGLGAAKMAIHLQTCGVDMLAVYDVDEAGLLVDAGVSVPILVLAPVRSISAMHPVQRGLGKGQIHLTVHGHSHLEAVARLAASGSGPQPIHVKVNTGLNRGGCNCSQAVSLIGRAKADDRVRLAGVMTHFAAAAQDERRTWDQHVEFDKVLMASDVPADVLIHEANTAAAIRWPWARRSMIRVGLAWAGHVPHGVDTDVPLQPSVRWLSKLAHVRRVAAGECVGYGAAWRADRDSLIGIIPVGYAAGFPIAAGAGSGGSGAVVAVRDAATSDLLGHVPVVGSVCMDQMAVDLTALAESVCGLDAEVELISPSVQSPASLPRLAEAAGVVPHAVLCGISSRIQRQYVSVVEARAMAG